jgi:hypothetical protein
MAGPHSLFVSTVDQIFHRVVVNHLAPEFHGDRMIMVLVALGEGLLGCCSLLRGTPPAPLLHFGAFALTEGA